MGAEMTSEAVLRVALDAVSAAIEAPSKTDAVFDARASLDGLDGETLRRVAGCLAVEMAYRPGVDRRGLQTWVDGMRLELIWSASSEEAS